MSQPNQQVTASAMTDLACRVRAFWDSIRAGARPGVSAEELTTFELLHGLTLPPDVAAFYRAVNGAVMDNEVFEAWPLAELGDVLSTVAPYRGIPDYGAIGQTLADAIDYVAFGDCMAFSQVLAVRVRPLEAGTSVLWIQGHHFAQVATSFEDFWERYLADPLSVLWARDVLIA